MKAPFFCRFRLFIFLFMVAKTPLSAAIADSLRPQQPPCEHCLLLPKGTQIKVKTISTVSSKGNKIQSIGLVIVGDVLPDGQHIVFKSGQSGTAEARIQKPRWFGKPATIELYALNVRTAKGQIVRVIGGEKTAKSHDDSGIVLGTGLGLPVACVALGWSPAFLLLCAVTPCIKGRHIEIPKDTEMTVEVARSVWVQY